MSAVAEFFEKIKATHATGQASEHSYRPALQDLFEALSGGADVINEAKRTHVGAPDFVFFRDGREVGHCEAKDVTIPLGKLSGPNKEQQRRYKKAFPNLLYTNGLEFEFWREAEKLAEVRIGEPLMGLQPIPEAFDELEHLLRDFFLETPRTIHSSKRLAELMAGKAAMIKDVIGKALTKDLEDKEDSDLTGQYAAFKEHLIHDIDPAEFADIYAETIAYGLFAARLHDPTLDTFSRIEALELLPKSNPFLRGLFSYIAGPELDDRIAWIIDDLTRIFLACNLQAIMADFGKLTGQNDPFLHFYETFLAVYNPARRKSAGVWYTPEPVVRYIVRAVDEVLITEFGLKDGLADTSKVRVEVQTGQKETTKRGKIKANAKDAVDIQDVHRVQILDPATGTGTFLAEVIKQIAPKIQGVVPGMWSSYIENELIPRLHGFELLMASYAMCHMKLDMILTEMNYKPSSNPPRLSVYLTNSLEEGEKPQQDLFLAKIIANEAKGANRIKRDMPIMCVIGNPPYLGEGGKSEGWLGQLMDDYKKEPGGIEKLKERNPKWINDLYVKFIRMSSHLIEKNGEGVLGFITNHGYLDNPTFRGMRWRLMKDFDKIWILDLHGNAKKKEVSPDGKPDKNVFDIQQGVAIIIAVKKRDGGDGLAEVRHGELWGSRANKYKWLSQKDETLENCKSILSPHPRYQMFYPVNDDVLDTYDAGFSLNEIFIEKQIGITTSRDHLAVDFTDQELIQKVNRFLSSHRTDDEVRAEFFGNKKSKNGRPAGDTASWSLTTLRKKMADADISDDTISIGYRPFDMRRLIYREDFLERPRLEIIPNLISRYNIAMSFNRKIDEARPFQDTFVFDSAVQLHSLSLKESNYFAPLYLYPTEDELDQTRRVNFDDKLHNKLRKLATHPEFGEPDEVAVFDYIYGVLYAPNYRETFAEFLKIDFPRIPWPQSPDVFWAVRVKGEALRRLHLMEDDAVGETPFPFLGEGDPVVEKPEFQATRDGLGEVWINGEMRFTGVPEIAWSFYIGGYQPAQKWLKDRKGRPLSFDDIRHYQKIIKILSETDRIMKEIELPLDLPDTA